MFKTRLISAIILIPVVLVVLFWAPTFVLMPILILALILAGRECWRLIPINNLALGLIFLITLFFVIWLTGKFFNIWLIMGLILWFLIFLAIITFPFSQKYWAYPAVVCLICWFVLALFVQSLTHLYFLPQGQALILYLFFLVWALDSGAYLAGSAFGVHKLIARVSPGKTWEGVVAGLILALLVAYFSVFYFQPPQVFAWLMLALITAGVAIFGDLFISILKRRCNLKDTGALIPGHGGILDRLDSLIAALPFFYFGVKSLCL